MNRKPTTEKRPATKIKILSKEECLQAHIDEKNRLDAMGFTKHSEYHKICEYINNHNHGGQS